jgi:iron complex outermembrane receptor protein
MFNKVHLYFFVCLLSLSTQAQNCNITLKGSVIDEGTQLPLSFVNVFVQETYRGTITNDKGNFTIDSLCSGEFHLIFSHIGCEQIKIHIDLEQDTTLSIVLSHTINSLGTITIKEKRETLNNQPNISISRESIEDNSNKNLAGLLENETGVHLLKNGSGMAIPIVHGLYGNRLTIINNGVIQSGQQWGTDHSPEIDPMSSDKISIIKGASAIEYGGGNLGSVILIDQKKIINEPHLHGQLNYAYESNGKGNNLNFRLEKYSSLFSWRINGTLKKYGDKNTPHYYLNNTGVEEADLSIQIEKSLRDKLFLNFYGSTFNSTIGILRGSHIGNLSDLNEALTREIPFFTEDNFSYKIDAPHQKVSHHLAKFKAKYLFNENQKLEIIAALQINDREEYDIRRGKRTEKPSMSLLQYTFNSEIKYLQYLNNEWKLKIGNQSTITDNTNNPETGILPLIPDYLTFKSGLFTTISKDKNKTHFNLGIRYDIEYQDVVTITKTIPKEIVRYNNDYHNISALSSLKFDISKNQFLSFNSGYASRNPAINEFYSSGLHQGVSGIEEGEINLKTEKAIKNTLEYKWFPNTDFTFNALIYHQYFKDYIFLKPENEMRLTIRGAFPVFNYEQTNANIYGLDISTQFTINNLFFGLLKYSYLKGQDIKNHIPLIFMPPNSLFGSLKYQLKGSKKLSQNVRTEKAELEINNKFVFEQKNILVDQDFIQPPPSYNLFGAKISTNLIFANYKIRIFAKAENIFNIEYREYLNRHRYFADDVGLSITFGLNFKF